MGDLKNYVPIFASFREKGRGVQMSGKFNHTKGRENLGNEGD